MANRTHLFVALNGASFGELGLGLRIARDLRERGEEVVFLAPATTAVLFRDPYFPHIVVNEMVPSIETELPRLVREKSFASVGLIDVVAVAGGLETVWGIDPGFLHELDVPVIALDNWNIRETDLRWDHGTEAFLAVTPKVLEFTKRLVPVPFGRPLRDVGFNALPPGGPPSEAERQAIRGELGFTEADRVVLLLSGTWQSPEAQFWKYHTRLARFLPTLLFQALAALGPRVRVLHVGPDPFLGAEALGDRYQRVPQVSAQRYKALMNAADMHLSVNASATSHFAATAMGLPIVLVMNSHSGMTVEEVLSKLPHEPAPAVRDWLPQVVPLPRFRVWPIGLYDLMTPVLADNPYMTTMEVVELLDWDALIAACERLLFDPAARAELQRRQADYCAMVRELPTGGEVFLSYL